MPIHSALECTQVILSWEHGGWKGILHLSGLYQKVFLGSFIILNTYQLTSTQINVILHSILLLNSTSSRQAPICIVTETKLLNQVS